ncbi:MULTISPECIES: tetratricopeptide repeat protein [unclassified Sphingomonas]|uniref:tetratricopeptide repeat protein n=1 Tax=unclassified Sphingomonas TaxID=196159 RepID=UPI002269B3C6|nr:MULTISPECIES: tetratricopeptide repeat protein [unclassified Sphingomonas]
MACLSCSSELTESFDLDMRFDHGGAWAGVEDLVECVYVDLLQLGEKELIDRHGYELHFVLRRRREAIPLRYASLTDLASGLEKTRNYPVDRAYRIVSGLTDLVLAWRALTRPDTIVRLVAHAADDAQHLARRFLTELARRGSTAGVQVIYPSSDATTLPSIDVTAAQQIASGGPEHLLDMKIVEEHHPGLLALHLQTGDQVAAARVALRALCLYNHFGYYHESGSFADRVIAHLDQLAGDDQEARWNYVGNIFQGLVMTGRLDQARTLVEVATAPKLSRPDLRAKMHYLLGMVHLRYAAQKDVESAERHLLEARHEIARAREIMASADHAFYSVFIENGLAFLRVRQGRPRDAIELCQTGSTLLERVLAEDEHRLHRSVLHYNTAQVYAMIGELDESLRFYDLSIEMDPYYSEYHNESGNLLLKAGRPQEALARYADAVRFSAPYPEVFHNMGICFARMSLNDKAREAFDRSLELDPAQVDVLLMRAEVLEALGESEQQLRDLDAAVSLDPFRLEARVNRAVARFERGEYDLALADMDHAIEISPMDPEFYTSRSEVHRAMGRSDLLAQDLKMAAGLEAA